MKLTKRQLATAQQALGYAVMYAKTEEETAEFAMLLMLTVPCGIEKVNTDKRLWVLRQLYFAGIGLLNLLA